MNRSLEGPARSLLNSFTVATTPPPRVTTASSGAPAVDLSQASDHLPGRDDDQEGNHVHHHQHHRQSNSGSHGSGDLSPPSAAASAADPEEEPQPSFIAPQPAPAPSSSADRSSERSATVPMPHGGLVSSSWQSAWRPSERLTEACSSANGGGGGGDGATTRGLSFTWRAAALETPTRPSPWGSHRLRTVGEGGGTRGETAERGGLTPKIRYRSASAGAPRASSSTATGSVGRHSPLQEQSLSRTPQRSLDSNGDWRGTGWGKAAADVHRGGNNGAATLVDGAVPMGSWQVPRGHAAPSLSPAVSVTPTQITPQSLWTADATAAAAAAPAVRELSRSGVGSGAAAALHPPPPFTRTKPGLRTQGASGFPAPHSPATDTSREAPPGQQPSAPLASRQVPMLQRGAAASTGSSRHVSTARSGPRVSFTDELDSAVVRADAHNGGIDDTASPSEFACTAGAELVSEADPLSHLTLRSLTEEYNHFSAEGTVGWVGLQVHLRRHTQSTQITALDLTCYRMRREQWLWFTQEILPDLRSLEVLRLVQMGLADEDAAALVRGCCGLGTHVEASRGQQQTSSSERTRTSAATAGALSPSSTAPPATASRPTSLQLLRVLDLSGNLITQRSCTHLGKMLLWMADSLEEVRLLGNPLKDYGMQTLGIYIAKLNVESLEEDPELFSGALRHQWRLLQEQQQQQQQHRSSASPTEAEAAVKALAEFTMGPVLLDLRDCRASARGLSDLLAAASRAHRLRVVVLSHNVAGVTALLPLPSAAFQEAADVATEATPLAGDASSTAMSGNSRAGPARVLRAGPAPRRLRLAKTPLISSGALMRRQQAAFSDVRGFATACAFAVLVFHGVPLSQTCSPVGCRELLLNIFFSSPQLELVDLSDTFEWALVPLAEQQRLVAEAVRRDVVEQRLRGPAVQRGLLMYREDQGEVEFVLDTATVAGQTRVGDIVCEFMAHAAHNAIVRQRLVPAAFAHIRELDLSHSGLTDAGVRGLCVSVRRGRARTGMLASLSVLNLSDNLLTVRGCVRVISSFLLEDTADADGGVSGIGLPQPEMVGGAAASRAAEPIAHMTALALQRNAGVLGAAEEGDEAWDGDRIAGYLTDGSTGGEVSPEAVGRGSGSRAPSCSPRESAAYLSEVCTAAETAVLRRATLRSAARGSHDSSGVSGGDGGAPALTIYFSAPPTSAAGSGSGSSDAIPNVYYAGCDERSDIFCTCPRSRFYVPKEKADRLVRAAAAPGGQPDATTTTTLTAAEQPFSSSSAAFTDPALPPTPLSGIGHVVTDAQRTFLSGRDVPRPSAATARSQLQLQRPSLTLSTPDVRLPPRPTFISAVDEANGLVHSGPLLSSMRGGRDPLVSSLLFPPPSIFDSRRTSQLHEEERGVEADEHHQQHQQHQQAGQTTTTAATSPTSRRGSLASTVGASLGSLFMDKSAQGHREEQGAGVAVRQGNDSDLESPAYGAAGTANASSAAAAECGDGERENLNSSTTRSGKRRAKARQTRTFVLSYDHPAGHLLCRALGVLLRPAPDAFGDGARAALSVDLLTALQRACARAAAYPEGDNSNSEDDARRSPRAAVVVEAVRYLPPDLTSDADGDEPHWMRFEVTTNERKARMAQRLQEVLNVSWAAQCVRFANLLQWLRAHVMGGSSGSGGGGGGEGDHSCGNGAVAEWDPVQAVERAARLSPAVRARLDTGYGGAAATAVHANHFAGGGSQPARSSGDTVDGGGVASQVMSLAQLHPTLWRALGLVSPDSGVGADSTPASTSQDPAAGYRQAKDTDVGEDGAGEDMYSAISASEDESRASQRDKGEGRVGGDASPGFEAAQLQPQGPTRLPVVDLYGNSRSPGSKQHQQRGDDGGATTPAACKDHGRSDKEGSPLHSPLQLVESPSGSSPLKAPLEDAEALTPSLAPPPTPPPSAPADDATSNAAAPQPSATEPRSPTSAAGTTSTLFSKLIRRFQAVTDSEEDDEADEKATTSVETPEKQTRGRERQRKAEVEREPEEQQEEAPPLSSPALQPAEDREAREGTGGGGALLTDQLLGPPSPSHGGDFKPRAADVAPLKQPSSARGAKEKATGEGKGEKGGSIGSTGNTESRRGEATRSDSPSSPASRQRASPVDEAPAKGGEIVEGDGDHAVLSPPVRVQRRPSELEGRVKTFTLSYTHQEGTAVCRAWRLLHSAMGGDAPGQERVSPTSPTSAALAQEARDCLCDDFLALLQPPDEDRKHVVLSVTLHGDGGAATAMLQVQVQTNERRATLANRLQESNHSVRRTASSAGRGSIVPLSVEEADRFYFPRLTRLLRRHKLTADTVAQMAPFLAARPAVEGRLVKSYGSIGALVHYYHGSATALEHELGIASWGELTGAVPAAPSPAPPAATMSAASIMEVPREAAEGVSSMLSATLVDVSSPTVASDRVLPSHDSGTQGERVSRAASPPESRRVGGGGVKAATTSSRPHPPPPPSQPQPVSVQGRPPPHPRRPPTPPNPITHTSSISFDEITEEPTSEAGPVVVLRGSTPSVAAAGRSPSTPSARNLQYFPVGYSGSTSLPHPSGSGVASGEGGEGHSSGSPERRRRSDADSDPGALSPMTSASTSPTKVRLSGASPPPHTQLTLEGSKFSAAAQQHQHHSQAARDEVEAAADAAAASLAPTSPSPQMPPRNLRGQVSAPDPPPRLPQMLETVGSTQHDRRGATSSPASNVNLSRQVSGSSTALTVGNGNKSDYERVLEGKYKRLMRVAYDGVARGSVPLEPQHQQKTVIGRGKWGTQKVVLSLEWEILFVLTFEKSRTLGRSSRRAQMVVHPVGIGFECMSGDEVGHQSGETSSLHSSMVNAMTAEGSGAYHPVGPTASQASKGSRGKRDGGKSAASHLLIMIHRPFSPDEVGSSSSEIEATLLAGALLTVSSAPALSKAAWLLGGGGSNSSNVGEEVSNTSRGSAGANQVAQDMVFQLCQRSLTLDIEMKSSKHVQEALRLLKNSIRRATQAVRKSMSNAHLPPPSAPT